MKKTLLAVMAVLFVGGGSLLVTGTASATNFGTGPGCSPIEGVNATTLTGRGSCVTLSCAGGPTPGNDCATDADCGAGDTFTGRIGSTAVSGFNSKGKPADDFDDDGNTDSVEECINDALIGFCTGVKVADAGVISVTPGATLGAKGNKQYFTVEFVDVNGCAVTECSDKVDNDGDGNVDYPADNECFDYPDDDEVNLP